MVSPLHIIVGLLSLTDDSRPSLADHDTHVDMSPVPAEDQPSNADDEQQDANEKGNDLVPLHGEESVPVITNS